MSLVNSLGMRGRRAYSDREKGEALALLVADGGNVQATAQALGIPDSTLDQWTRGQGVNSNAEAVRNLLRSVRARAQAEARAALKGKDLLDVLKYVAREMEKDVRSRERERQR